MSMALEKAKRVLKEYNENNFNASIALQKAGYSQSMATKGSKVVLNSAIKKVVRSEMEGIVNSSNPLDKLFQYMQMTPDDVRDEYKKIITQDKDLTNKLKALIPLLKTQGIVWEEQNTSISPTLNLTVKSNSTPITPIIENEYQEPSAVRDIEHNVIDNNVNDVLSSEPNEDSCVQGVAQQSSICEHGRQCILCDVDKDNKSIESDGGGVDVSTIGIKEV